MPRLIKIAVYFLVIFFSFLFFTSQIQAAGTCKWVTNYFCHNLDDSSSNWVRENGQCDGAPHSGYNTVKCCCQLGCCQRYPKEEKYWGEDVTYYYSKTKNECNQLINDPVYKYIMIGMGETGVPAKTEWIPGQLAYDGKCVSARAVNNPRAYGCCKVYYKYLISENKLHDVFNSTQEECQSAAVPSLQIETVFYQGYEKYLSDSIKNVYSCRKVAVGSGTEEGGNPPEEGGDPDKKSTVTMPKFTELTNPLRTTDIPVVAGRVVKAILLIIGSLAFIMFVYGGILWMTAAGNEQKVEKGRNTLIWAALGLIIIFSAYILVKYVMEAIGAIG